MSFFKELLAAIEDRIAKANGDVIEAIHGHECGFDCWHAMGFPVVCCLRPGEESRPATFGDYSLCARCRRSVTSKDAAFRVKRL